MSLRLKTSSRSCTHRRRDRHLDPRYHISSHRMSDDWRNKIQELTSQELTCVDCNRTFSLPASEQLFRREQGLTDPESCPECRLRQRAARNADLISLYERVNASSSHGEYRDRRRKAPSRGGQPEGVRQRFNTGCASCGAETQVPFVPRGDRPVYCRACYNAHRGR